MQRELGEVVVGSLGVLAQRVAIVEGSSVSCHLGVDGSRFASGIVLAYIYGLVASCEDGLGG